MAGGFPKREGLKDRMQPSRGGGGGTTKAKLARSYQELLDEFSNTELKSVGNYQLGRLIGKGSFGKVYLASHKLTNGSKVGCSATVDTEERQPSLVFDEG